MFFVANPKISFQPYIPQIKPPQFLTSFHTILKLCSVHIPSTMGSSVNRKANLIIHYLPRCHLKSISIHHFSLLPMLLGSLICLFLYTSHLTTSRSMETKEMEWKNHHTKVPRHTFYPQGARSLLAKWGGNNSELLESIVVCTRYFRGRKKGVPNFESISRKFWEKSAESWEAEVLPVD